MTEYISGTRGEGRNHAGIATELRRGVRAADVGVIAAIPALLLAVFVLPRPLKVKFALAYTEPTLATAFVSHFVHMTWGHLLSNLGGYALVIAPTYLFCALSGRRREFFVAFVTFLVAFPFAISGLNVLFVRPRIGYGFSGIIMAFLGFLPLALVWFLEARLAGGVELSHAPVLYFVVMGVVAVWAVPSTPGSHLAESVVGLSLVGYGRSMLSDLPARLGPSLGEPRTAGYLELALSGLSIYLLFPFAAFPPDPAGQGTILNVLSHLLGYSLGFIVPFVTFCLLERRSPPASSSGEPEGWI